MKLKSTLLSLAMALAFTMPIDAAQYTVPEGQPPVPGADASIPDTAYQNYRYGEALNANASAIILARKHIYEMVDKQVQENKEVSKKQNDGRKYMINLWIYLLMNLRLSCCTRVTIGLK